MGKRPLSKEAVEFQKKQQDITNGFKDEAYLKSRNRKDPVKSFQPVISKPGASTTHLDILSLPQEQPKYTIKAPPKEYIMVCLTCGMIELVTKRHMYTECKVCNSKEYVTKNMSPSANPTGNTEILDAITLDAIFERMAVRLRAKLDKRISTDYHCIITADDIREALYHGFLKKHNTIDDIPIAINAKIKETAK